jgi:hypothetical protein
MLIGTLHLERGGKSLAGTLTRDWLIKAGESVIVRRVPGTDTYELIALPFATIDTTAETLKALNCLPEGKLSPSNDGKLTGEGKPIRITKTTTRKATR